MYAGVMFVVSNQGPSMASQSCRERQLRSREVTGPALGCMAVEGCEGPTPTRPAQVPSPTPQLHPCLLYAGIWRWPGQACGPDPHGGGLGGAPWQAAQPQPPEGGSVKSPLVLALSLHCLGL